MSNEAVDAEGYYQIFLRDSHCSTNLRRRHHYVGSACRRIGFVHIHHRLYSMIHQLARGGDRHKSPYRRLRCRRSARCPVRRQDHSVRLRTVGLLPQ
jgi:hypothetical protein